MIRKLAFASVLAAGFFSSGAFALGLGELNLQSRLSQPLKAEIPISTATADQLETLEVKLASEAAFERAGIERNDAVGAFRFRIDRSAEAPRILVTTQENLREPFVTFLIDARFAGGRILREYTMFLNPPVISAAPPAAQTSAAATSSSATPSPVSTRRAASPAATRTAPRTATASSGRMSDSSASADASGSYGPVSPKQTLWNIASQVRPDDSVSMSQVMLALYRANPEAFDGNINRLLKGSLLQVPSRESMLAVAPEAAKSEVARQHSNYTPPTLSSTTRQPAPQQSTSQDTSTASESTGKSASPSSSAGTQASTGSTSTGSTSTSAAARPSTATAGTSSTSPTPKPKLEDLIRMSQKGVGDEATATKPADDTVSEKPADDTASEKATADTTVEIDSTAPEATSSQVTIPQGAGAVESGDTAQVTTEPAIEAEAGDVKPIDASTDEAPTDPESAFAALQQIAKGEEPTGDAATADSSAADTSAGSPAESVPVVQSPDVGATDSLTDDGDAGDSLGLLKYVAAGGGALALLAGGFFAYRRLRSSPSGDEVDTESMFNPSDSVTMMNQDLPGADQATEMAGHLGDTVATGEQEAFDVSEPPPENFDSTREMPAADVSGAAPLTESQVVEEAPAEQPAADSDDFQMDIDAHEVDLELDDPISEADFHLAYGLYDEASLLLEQAIETNPDRVDLKAKLLEAYFAGGKTDQYNAVAQQYHDQIADPSSDAEWQKIAIMGQQIAPDNEIYTAESSEELLAGDSDALDMDLVGEGDDDDAGLDFDLGGDDSADASADASLEMEDPAAAMMAAAAPEAGAGVVEDETSEAPATEPVEAMPEAVADSDAVSLDFDADASPSLEVNAVEDEAVDTATDDSAAGNELEFDLGDFDVDSSAGDGTPAESAEAAADLDDSGFELDLDDFGTDEPSGDAPMEGEDPGSKLDLARAYVDMGDNDMARGLLNEVLESGDEAQISEAKELMSQIS